MSQIGITLYSNRTYKLDNPDDVIIIAGENQATTINVKFPIEYELYSKRVDLINIKGEKWTEALYMPEDERNLYDLQFNKNNFVYTLPDAMTHEGELLMQFIAYKVDSDIFVPFELVKLTVKVGINCCRNVKRNPDLILKAYEYSNNALSIARDSIARLINVEKKTDSIETSLANILEKLKKVEETLANIGSGGGGDFQLPTDQGETNFLAGDGTYKKLKEMSNESSGALVRAGIGETNDVLIKRIDGVIEQSVSLASTQMELKTTNTTSKRSSTVLLYATGMMRLQVSNGTTTDTLEMMNGTLRFNSKKVLTEV